MWLDKQEVSEWAYKYCIDVKDDPEVRKYITDPEWVYHYCKEVNDDPEIKKYMLRRLCG